MTEYADSAVLAFVKMARHTNRYLIAAIQIANASSGGIERRKRLEACAKLAYNRELYMNIARNIKSRSIYLHPTWINCLPRGSALRNGS